MDVAVEYVWRILADTPWWVWVLFVFLVIRGVKSMRPATGPLWRFAIVPAVFLLWGLSSLVDSFGATALSLGSYIVALAIGAAAGWALMAPVPVRADRAHGLVAVPGGPATLILILAVFAVKYGFGVWQGMDPQVVGNIWFLLADCGISGIVAGMFIGRFANLWRKYRDVPEENLAQAAG